MVGGLITIAGIVLIVMIHETGHFVAAKAFGMKATEYFLGFGPRLWSFRRGETEYGIKAIPAGGYVKIIGMSPLEEVAPEEEHRTYRGKPFWQKAIVVMAGIASHFVIAFILLWVAATAVGQRDVDDPTLRVRSVVVETEDGVDSPAYAAGLRPGDRFLAIDGVPVAAWDDLTTILRSRPDEPVTLTIERSGEQLELSTVLTSRTDRDTGETTGFLGVSPELAVVRENPVAALGSAGVGVATLTVDSFRGIASFVTEFGGFVTTVLSGEEPEDNVRPISAVGLVQLGADERLGIGFTLTLLAFFSIFVGVLNAIPVYPFDGGHFVVALWEKVTGRHPDIRKLVPVSAAIFLFLMVLGILAIYFDIVNPIDLG